MSEQKIGKDASFSFNFVFDGAGNVSGLATSVVAAPGGHEPTYFGRYKRN